MEELAGGVQVLKLQAENFGGEVTNQTRLLGQLNNKIDRTNMKLVKVTSRLGRTVAKVDVTVMWIIIAIEILLIVLVICI